MGTGTYELVKNHLTIMVLWGMMVVKWIIC